MDKVITIKDRDEVIYEFVITKAELDTAEKLGIEYKKYIVERARAELKEKKYEPMR